MSTAFDRRPPGDGVIGGRRLYTSRLVAPPKRKGGSRVTPKGTRPGSSSKQLPTAGAPPVRGSDPHHAVSASSRYTPPVPSYMKESPRWVPILMFALWIVGAIIIILYYLGAVPGGRSQWYLLIGLGMILGGLYTATKYR